MLIGGNSTIFTNPQANVIAPSGAAAREPVGEESRDNKDNLLKPVEQTKETDASTRVKEKDEQRQQQQQAEKQFEQKKGLEQERAEQKVIDQLSARDREVRNHERAHAAVGGQYAGGPRYQYQRGPDGVNYAVAGEVSISTSAIPGDPQATITKAQQVKRAALAPAEPSPQDRRVAAEAAQTEAQARVDLQEQRLEARRVEEQEQTENRDLGQQQGEQPVTSNDNDDDAEATPNELAREREQQQAMEEQVAAFNQQLNRRLIDIGVGQPAPEPGEFISQFI